MTCKKLVTASLLAMTVAAPAMAEVESQEPIRMTLHDWTGQLLTTHIMGGILEEAGYNVEYVQADYIAQFAGLESGDLHVAMEIWATTGQEAMDAAIATGNVVSFGPTGMQAIEDWWYPSYMEEQCPGLPDWQALNDCAQLFSTAETAPFGRYLGGPVTWGGFDEERIEALGLDFEVVHAGTDAALFAELESAYQRQAPIVLWIYTPHWATSRYDGSFVEFPAYEPACYEDPSWGVNPDMAYDCGKPRGDITAVGWAGVPEQWPGAALAIEAFTISNDDMSEMVGLVDLDGEAVEDVAARWIADHEDTWRAWIQ